MKCITLTQPWASLVAVGAKKIETRSWKTSYRGPLAIHAAKGPGEFSKEELTELIRDRFHAGALRRQDGTLPTWQDLPLGQIIAVCRLHDCLEMDHRIENLNFDEDRFDISSLGSLTEQERAFGNFDIWRYAWILEDVTPIHPIPFRGAQRLWDLEADICFPQGQYPDWLRQK